MIRRDRPRGRSAPTARAARMRADDTDAWYTAPQPRRRRSVRRTLRTIFVLVLLGAVIGGVLLGLRVAAFNDRVSTAPAFSSALLGPLNGEERVNVVLVGYGGGTHDGAYLADSITILSIDPTTDTTTTIPVPRDLWIEGLTGLPDNGKVNEAFAIGFLSGGLEGAGETMGDVLTDVTGLRIDHWMAIDFDGFREMVDAVGGVTVTNPVAFSWTSNETFFEQGIFNGGTFEAGELDLDGTQALAYSRARYTSVVAESSDFARAVRQQRILAALRSELGDGGLGSFGPGLRLMGALEDHVTTDLSAIDLFLLSGHLGSDRRIDLAEDVVLRATTNTDGQYILIPVDWTGPADYDLIHGYLAERLAEPLPTPSPTPVTGAP